MSKLPLRSQCLDGTGFCTALAQDTLRCILAMAGVIAYLYIHWAHLQAFTTLDALALVAPDTQPREIAHGLQEHRDWTDVLTESSIVLEEESECDAHEIIEHITSQKQFEHGGLVGFAHQKQHHNESQGEGKHDVSDVSQSAPPASRCLIRQQVENHGRPTGIAAPSSAEQ